MLKENNPVQTTAAIANSTFNYISQNFADNYMFNT